MTDSREVLGNIVATVKIMGPFEWPPGPLIFVFYTIVVVGAAATRTTSMRESTMKLQDPVELVELRAALITGDTTAGNVECLGFSPVFPVAGLLTFSAVDSTAT